MIGKLQRAAWLLRHGGRLRPMFSQYGEDVALRTLLRPQGNGVYVDVGANDPIAGSNTAYLYMQGWSGLAIDPNPAFAARFKAVRPRDRFLNMGVSKTPAELTYYEFDRHLLNTFSEARAEQLAQEGVPAIKTSRVRCEPLKSIIDAHLPGRHVDLLAVDCEGLDLEVLESAELERLRPTVLMVEDFLRYCHFRDGEAQGPFDGYLRASGYSPIAQMAWSSIYVADHWRDLPKGAFRPPENLDGYMPRGGTRGSASRSAA